MKKLLWFPVVLMTFVLVACSSKSSVSPEGIWTSSLNGVESELVVAGDSFTMDVNYTEQGLFTSSDKSIRLASGNIDTKSKTLFLTYVYNDEDIEIGEEGMEISYTVSEDTLTLDIEGDKLIYKKAGSGNSDD